jgi:hypothetical protein
MKCPHCQRLVRPSGALMKKALPYCGACRRYVLTPAHRLTLAALALAALLLLLMLLGRP